MMFFNLNNSFPACNGRTVMVYIPGFLIVVSAMECLMNINGFLVSYSDVRSVRNKYLLLLIVMLPSCRVLSCGQAYSNINL